MPIKAKDSSANIKMCNRQCIRLLKHLGCHIALFVRLNVYLGVGIEHLDSLSGDKEIHLCDGLRFSLRSETNK